MFGKDTARLGQQKQQQQEFLNKNGFRNTPEVVPACPAGTLLTGKATQEQEAKGELQLRVAPEACSQCPWIRVS